MKDSIQQQSGVAFNKNSEDYKDLKASLQALKKDGKVPVLSIHMPGTGGARDSMYPTRMAFHQHGTPCIFLDGLGSCTEIQPVLRSTYDIKATAPRVNPPLLKSVVTFFSNPTHKDFSNPDILLQTNSGALIQSASGNTAVPLSEIVFGAGKKTHKELILNTLSALASDGVLPEQILWTGHSRGAQASVYAAYFVDEKYSAKITHDFILTDPVPGPFGKDKEDTIFPNSTRTVTLFYAPKEERVFFKPYDLSRLKFPKNAIVTSFPIPDATHQTIAGSDPFTNRSIRDLVKILAPKINTLEKYCNLDTDCIFDFDPSINVLTDEKVKQVQHYGDEAYNIDVKKEGRLSYLDLTGIRSKLEDYKQHFELTAKQLKCGKANLFLIIRESHDKFSIAYFRSKKLEITRLAPEPFMDLSVSRERIRISPEMSQEIHKKTGEKLRPKWTLSGAAPSTNRSGMAFYRQDPLSKTLPEDLRQGLKNIRTAYGDAFEKEYYLQRLKNMDNLVIKLRNICKNNQKRTLNCLKETGNYVQALTTILKCYPDLIGVSDKDKQNILAKYNADEIKEMNELLTASMKQHDANNNVKNSEGGFSEKNVNAITELKCMLNNYLETIDLTETTTPQKKF